MEERPLECNQCRKSIEVFYQEFVGGNQTCYHMCLQCPILQSKLGEETHEFSFSLEEKEGASSCSSCKTTKESFLLGEPLGCAQCYIFFEKTILTQLEALDAIAPHSKKGVPSVYLHSGKTPEPLSKTPLKKRLVVLTESLDQALREENYEEAAWIRDQIKILKNQKPPNEDDV